MLLLLFAGAEPVIVPGPTDGYADAVLIGHTNKIDTATLSGGSWETALPLTNLKDRNLGKVARSQDALAASTVITIDLGSQTMIQVVGLVNHSMSDLATVRIEYATDSGFTDLMRDTGAVEVWGAVYNTEDLEFEADNWWDGKYTEAEKQGYRWTHVDPARYASAIRYLRITILDEDNPNGFVDLGRLFVGEAWQPKVGMQWGAELGLEDTSEALEAISGAEYFIEHNTRRNAVFETNYMTPSDGRRAFELSRQSGVSRELLFCWDPTDSIDALRRNFLCRLGQISPIVYPLPDRASKAWELRELL